MINLSKEEITQFDIIESNLTLRSFDDIQWKYQDCNEESLLILNLANDKVFIEKHLGKLLSIKPAIVVTNSLDVYNLIKMNMFGIYLKGNEFFKLREYICDKKFKRNQNQKIIGITGTNGKTSVANYIVQLANSKNKQAYTIGTLGVYDGEFKHNFGLTTPDYVDLRKYMDEFYDYDLLALEASSHALEQNRFFGLQFDVACWTNLTQDHLDYHKDMKSYFNAKKKIINYLKPNSKLLVSLDMENYLNDLPVNTTEIATEIKTKLPNLIDNMITRKNLGLACIALKNIYSIDFLNFEFLKPIPGRFNTFIKDKLKAIVDFAHTPDALENICKQIKSDSVEKFVVVFGCGGDRDPTKRSLMGDIAYRYSDFAIITNDNPRTEDPTMIAAEIVKNFTNDSKYEIILDRKLAIKKAFEICNEGVILVAGKGHEEYIEINNEKKYYSDIEEVEKNMK